jgi:hypothetical protein
MCLKREVEGLNHKLINAQQSIQKLSQAKQGLEEALAGAEVK